MASQFTIVVSSSDEYEDCWFPFFTLLSKHWPDCDLPILLNTQKKRFSYPGLRIFCPAVARSSRRDLKWGARLRKSLEQVEDEFILFMLDDYFIRAPVAVDRIREFISWMHRDRLSHIMLYPIPGPNHPCSYPMLVERGDKAVYRFSLQVGLWRTERFRSYLRDHENPWQTERWGTRRAWKLKDSFFCLDERYLRDKGAVIDYPVLGGIVGGKWVSEKVVHLFRQHGIAVDYSKRGFYEPRTAHKLSTRLSKRIANLPGGLWSLFDLYFRSRAAPVMRSKGRGPA